jgi:acetyl-CoA synthetase
MLTRDASAGYEAVRRSFHWRLPRRYNLGVDVCDRQHPTAPAILVADGHRVTRCVTFGELAELSNRFANVLRGVGVGEGDRVAILLPQRLETAVAHIAVYKLGAIAVPLSVLFGPEALEVRLADADPAVVIGETEAVERVAGLDRELATIDVDRDFEALLERASPRFEPVPAGRDSPALIIYTSGTTGPPKGALHAHRVLYGHLPGFELSHEFFPKTDDLIWTPADWAWIGGLFDVLMPSLHHGRPVVAFRPVKFDPEQAFDVIARLGIRNVFIPPTALRMMRAVDGPRLSLRTVASGGESVDEETLAWSLDRLGAPVNEFYGQTEANLLVGNCAAAWPIKAGWMGRPYPGHDVRVIGGEIAVRCAGDPVVFLGYWRNPEATAEKIREGWLRTGDLAEVDEEGNLRYLGRADDIIVSAGYRIGPGEVEQSLLRHPAVALAAVVGSPDELRGEIVKAFVVLVPGAEPSPELAAGLQGFVRSRLAIHEYPREVEFADELPLTTTGKIRRGELRRLEAERKRRMSSL